MLPTFEKCFLGARLIYAREDLKVTPAKHEIVGRGQCLPAWRDFKGYFASGLRVAQPITLRHSL